MVRKKGERNRPQRESKPCIFPEQKGVQAPVCPTSPPQTCTQLACRILRYYIIYRPKNSFSPVLIEEKSVVLLCEAALARAGVEGPRSSSFTLDA
jgi:hypothetical protein